MRLDQIDEITESIRLCTLAGDVAAWIEPCRGSERLNHQQLVLFECLHGCEDDLEDFLDVAAIDQLRVDVELVVFSQAGVEIDDLSKLLVAADFEAAADVAVAALIPDKNPRKVR